MHENRPPTPLTQQEEALLKKHGHWNNKNEKAYQITPDFIKQEEAQQIQVQTPPHQTQPVGHASKVFPVSDKYHAELAKQQAIKNGTAGPMRIANMHFAPLPAQGDVEIAFEPEAGGGNGGGFSPPGSGFVDDFNEPANNLGTSGVEHDPADDMFLPPSKYAFEGAPVDTSSAKINGLKNKTTAIWATELLWDDIGPWIVYEASKLKIDVRHDLELSAADRKFVTDEVRRHNSFVKNNSDFPDDVKKEWCIILTEILDKKGWNVEIPAELRLILATAKLIRHGFVQARDLGRQSEVLKAVIEDKVEAMREETRKQQAILDSIRKAQEDLAKREQAIKETEAKLAEEAKTKEETKK